MRDLEHPGDSGKLDTALRLVESELPPLGYRLQAILAVLVYGIWMLVEAIDRHRAQQPD